MHTVSGGRDAEGMLLPGYNLPTYALCRPCSVRATVQWVVTLDKNAEQKINGKEEFSRDEGDAQGPHS